MNVTIRIEQATPDAQLLTIVFSEDITNWRWNKTSILQFAFKIFPGSFDIFRLLGTHFFSRWMPLLSVANC